MKIDIFCHILPQACFDRMTQMAGRGAYMQKRVREIPVFLDLDQRFRVLGEFGDYRQVFSLATPSIEAIAGPEDSPELARIANDGHGADHVLFSSDMPFDPEQGPAEPVAFEPDPWPVRPVA